MKKILSLVLVAIILTSVSIISFSAMPAPTHWYGDVDGSRKIEVTDATEIQRYLASHVEFSKLGLILADFDGDGSISIMDATNIQMYIAKKPSNRRKDDHIYCMPDVDGIVANYSSSKAMTGVPVEFTINSSMYFEYEAAYPLSFKCYLLDEYYENPVLIYSGYDETFEYTFDTAGTYYLQVYVYNDFGDNSINDMMYQVVEKQETESLTASISSKHFIYVEGEEREFVAFAHGGKGPYEYCFTDGNTIYQDYSEDNTLTLEPEYKVEDFVDDYVILRVRDADGNVATDMCIYTLMPDLPA